MYWKLVKHLCSIMFLTVQIKPKCSTLWWCHWLIKQSKDLIALFWVKFVTFNTCFSLYGTMAICNSMQIEFVFAVLYFNQINFLWDCISICHFSIRSNGIGQNIYNGFWRQRKQINAHILFYFINWVIFCETFFFLIWIESGESRTCWHSNANVKLSIQPWKCKQIQNDCIICWNLQRSSIWFVWRWLTILY